MSTNIGEICRDVIPPNINSVASGIWFMIQMLWPWGWIGITAFLSVWVSTFRNFSPYRILFVEDWFLEVLETTLGNNNSVGDFCRTLRPSGLVPLTFDTPDWEW